MTNTSAFLAELARRNESSATPVGDAALSVLG